MAPNRKRKSDEMADPSTPEASGTPAPKKMRITQTQKQALIDNLQLEITERARHLRAHYALQCADLKSRIERRINRIPMSMRSMTMKELMEKHQPRPASPPKQSPIKPIAIAKTQQSASARTTRKRKSSIVIAADPPQEHDSSHESTATTQPVVAAKSNPKRAKRPGSRTGRGAGGVLSPRSHNSRSLPRSPIKGNPVDSATDYSRPAPSSPAKIHTARPLSPLKPHSPLKSAAIATTSAISSSVHNIISTAKSTARGAKATTRPATAATARTVSQASNHSAASNTTTTSTGTVVKSAAASKPKTVRGRAAAATKKAATAAINAGIERATTIKEKPAAKTTRAGTVKKATTTAAAKKAAATTATTAEPTPATGKRTLRKRN